MSTWSTIHIFQYDYCQIIGSVDNGQISTGLVTTTLNAFYAALASIATSGITVSIADTYLISINDQYSVTFLPNDRTHGNSLEVWDWSALDTATITSIANLATDIAAHI